MRPPHPDSPSVTSSPHMVRASSPREVFPKIPVMNFGFNGNNWRARAHTRVIKMRKQRTLSREAPRLSPAAFLSLPPPGGPSEREREAGPARLGCRELTPLRLPGSQCIRPSGRGQTPLKTEIKFGFGLFGDTRFTIFLWTPGRFLAESESRSFSFHLLTSPRPSQARLRRVRVRGLPNAQVSKTSEVSSKVIGASPLPPQSGHPAALVETRPGPWLITGLQVEGGEGVQPARRGTSGRAPDLSLRLSASG